MGLKVYQVKICTTLLFQCLHVHVYMAKDYLYYKHITGLMVNNSTSLIKSICFILFDVILFSHTKYGEELPCQVTTGCYLQFYHLCHYIDINFIIVQDVEI